MMTGQGTVEAPSLLSGVEARGVDATLACVARHGLGKTTFDDVAREAGCARATLYRYFNGKHQLVRAAVASEAVRLVDAVTEAAARRDDLEDAVVDMVVTAARRLAEHEALQFILAFEPELALPHLTFDAGSRFLTAAGDALASTLTRFVPAERAQRAGEWLARVVFAYAVIPVTPVNLTDESVTRAFLREYVLPGLVDRESVLPSSEPTRG